MDEQKLQKSSFPILIKVVYIFLAITAITELYIGITGIIEVGKITIDNTSSIFTGAIIAFAAWGISKLKKWSLYVGFIVLIIGILYALLYNLPLMGIDLIYLILDIGLIILLIIKRKSFIY